MLDKRNAGLGYVRELVLYTAGSVSIDAESLEDPRASGNFQNHQRQHPCPDALLLLQQLPQNVLEHFSWKSSQLIPADVVLALWERQHNIAEFKIIPCTKDYDSLFLKNQDSISKSLKNITVLYIRLKDSYHTPNAGKYILQSYPKVDKLIVDHWKFGYEVEGDGTDDCGGLFIRNLSDNTQAFAITTLNLYFVDLRRTLEDIVESIQIDKLRNLDLHGCNGTEIFLDALTAIDALTTQDDKDSFHMESLQLKTLSICHKEETGSYHIVGAIDDFLACFSNTLTSLTIVLRGCTKLPKVKGIVAHGSTLKRLFLDVRSKEGPYGTREYARTYSLRAWKKLCKRLSRAEQLGAAFPVVVADGRGDTSGSFMEYVFLTCQIPHLKTLNITTLPRTIGSSAYTRYPATQPFSIKFSAHVELMSMLANDIFQARHTWAQDTHGSTAKAPLDLQALAFGIHDQGRLWLRPDRRVPVIYWAPTLVHNLDDDTTVTQMRRTTLAELLQTQFWPDLLDAPSILDAPIDMYKPRYINGVGRPTTTTAANEGRAQEEEKKEKREADEDDIDDDEDGLGADRDSDPDGIADDDVDSDDGGDDSDDEKEKGGRSRYAKVREYEGVADFG